MYEFLVPPEPSGFIPAKAEQRAAPEHASDILCSLLELLVFDWLLPAPLIRVIEHR